MRRVDRLGVTHAALLLFALALVGKAAHVQLWQGAQWSARANSQHFAASTAPAPRGEILDAAGRTLVESRQLVRLTVAPREVRDRRSLGRALTRAGIAASWVARATDPRRAWVELPGSYLPTDVPTLLSLRGVRAEPVSQRVNLAPVSARRLLGRVGVDGAPVDGVELALDSVLRGQRGSGTVLRDARGRTFESPTTPGVAARPGNTIMLTINTALQEICDRALADAVSRMGADGGDIVVLDPQTGDVLAMASRRSDPRSTASTALTEPFEPGSTLKPFIAARLLALGRARPEQVVNTYNGTYVLDGRTITDEHKAPRMTLSEVISNSSNIGIVQFAARLTQGEEYESLRDAGFGTPTGVPYPSEAAGTLREPHRWSKTSAASMAMGYEVSVTALQLATAYASIANGGELLEPSLVKEVRDADGRIIYKHERRLVRRVMPPEVARTVRDMLVETVEKGTAVDADLSTFQVAGKTGTARRATGGRYLGQHTASYVGLFPARDPQFVILVKMDNPRTVYFGGKAAAPVSKIVLEAAIAARDAALNRGALAARDKTPKPSARDSGRPPRVLPDDSLDRPDGVAASSPARDTAAPAPFVITLGARPAPTAPAPPPAAVPEVRGLPLRAAVRALHEAGFQVQLGVGPAGATVPSAGTTLRAGSIVKLFREP